MNTFGAPQWLIDRVVQVLSLVHPKLLTRDTIKMCWQVGPAPLPVSLPFEYRLGTLTSRDAPADWIALMTASGMPVTAPTWSSEFAERPGSRVFSIHDGPRLVAAAGLRPIAGAPSSSHLMWVGVHPDYRGHHLGRALTVAAMTFAAEQGMETVMLLTDDFRLPALHIYLQLGFQPCLGSWDRTQRFRWRRIAQKLRSPIIFCRRPDHRTLVANLSK